MSGANPVAAMPSLHAAYPTYIAMVAIRVWGKRGIPTDALVLGNPEGNRDAKGVLNALMGGVYSERIDQPKLAAVFDLDQAAACRSFRKFQSAVSDLLGQL